MSCSFFLERRELLMGVEEEGIGEEEGEGTTFRSFFFFFFESGISVHF